MSGVFTASPIIRLFIHVDEPSMAAALEQILPKLTNDTSVKTRIIDHGSKTKLLSDISSRMQRYAQRSLEDIRVIVLVDRDSDDCRVLKRRLEDAALAANLKTKSSTFGTIKFNVVNRIVVEELEAWFFGDVNAIRTAYPRVPVNLGSSAKFREPDAIAGGTWEALLRVLQKAGYYQGQRSLPKIEVARRVAAGMQPERNRSRSFLAFTSGLTALLNDVSNPA